METPFTCITCRMIFADLAQQKSHYQTTWHCFNLKRKVAGLAPVTQEVFNEKVAALKEDTEGRTIKKTRPVNPKKQHKFKREKARNKFTQNASALPNELQGLGKVGDDEEPEEAQKTEEELIEERLKTAKAIPTTDSLFDNHKEETLETNLEYMRKNFGFFVPDVDYLVDLDGLIAYLGQKIGIGYACIYCPREFHSVGAVQSHMVDKCHCKINFYGHEEEFEDFYDWSPLLADGAQEGGEDTTEREKEPEGGDENKQIIAVTETDVKAIHLTETGGELVLPSGVAIGHRAFMTYYKQRHHPKDTRISVVTNQLARQYRDLGIETPTNDVDYRAQRKKDLQWMQLGLKANKLPKFMRHNTSSC